MNFIHLNKPVAWGEAVTYGNINKTRAESLLEIADDYFNLSGRKVQVVPLAVQGNSQGVLATYERSSFLKTALKIASYAFFVIPLIMLATKLVLRSIYKFHYIAINNPSSGQPSSGNGSNIPVVPGGPNGPNGPNDGPDGPNGLNGPNGPNDPNGPNGPTFPILPFDQPTRLSLDETIRLQLRSEVLLQVRFPDPVPVQIGNEMLALAQRAPEYVPVVDEKHYSDHAYYQDSYFTARAERVDGVFNHYWITRKAKNDGKDCYLAINQPTRLSKQQFERLGFAGHEMDTETGTVYGTSALPEYQGSRFAVQELSDVACLVTRMAEPS